MHEYQRWATLLRLVLRRGTESFPRSAPSKGSYGKIAVAPPEGALIEGVEGALPSLREGARPETPPPSSSDRVAAGRPTATKRHPADLIEQQRLEAIGKKRIAASKKDSVSERVT